MSFGFSGEDIITVCQLANNIRREFVRAPAQTQRVSDEYAP